MASALLSGGELCRALPGMSSTKLMANSPL
jgi:hypothetical protein